MGRSIKAVRPARTLKSHNIVRSDEDEIETTTGVSSTKDTDRSVYLIGEITETSTVTVIQNLVNLSQTSDKPIRFIISTYGGSIDESLAIYDTMKLIRAPVHTVGIGKIMSAGVLLLASGVKGRRVIGARSRIMIHNAFGGAVGDPWEIHHELNEFKRQAELEEECLLRETKLTKKQLVAILKNRMDYYITPEQAIKYGIADKITK